MNEIENYYNYNQLEDWEKGKIIAETLEKCSKIINQCHCLFNFNCFDDFYSEVTMMIIKIYSDQKFKFKFYENKESLYQSVLCKKEEYNYYRRYISSKCGYANNPYSKKFIYFIYEQYKEHCFWIFFKSYLNKSIINLSTKYYAEKKKHYYVIYELNDYVENNYSNKINNTNTLLEILYLSDNDKKLLNCFIEKGKILTIKEVSQKYNINQKTLYRKLKNIKDKIYETNK